MNALKNIYSKCWLQGNEAYTQIILITEEIRNVEASEWAKASRDD